MARARGGSKAGSEAMKPGAGRRSACSGAFVATCINVFLVGSDDLIRLGWRAMGTGKLRSGAAAFPIEALRLLALLAPIALLHSGFIRN